MKSKNMKNYIGVKEIKAKPCGRNAFNRKHGKMVAEVSEERDTAGYKVVYDDGYEFWSPKKAFEDAYRENVPLEKLENPGEMLPHQIRVVEEAYALDDKIDLLDNFLTTPIFAELEKDEQGRLRSQLLAMKAYLTILIDRINNFEKKKK